MRHRTEGQSSGGAPGIACHQRLKVSFIQLRYGRLEVPLRMTRRWIESCIRILSLWAAAGLDFHATHATINSMHGQRNGLL
jgi:hypothetical protein